MPPKIRTLPKPPRRRLPKPPVKPKPKPSVKPKPKTKSKPKRVLPKTPPRSQAGYRHPLGGMLTMLPPRPETLAQKKNREANEILDRMLDLPTELKDDIIENLYPIARQRHVSRAKIAQDLEDIEVFRNLSRRKIDGVMKKGSIETAKNLTRMKGELGYGRVGL